MIGGTYHQAFMKKMSYQLINNTFKKLFCNQLMYLL